MTPQAVASRVRLDLVINDPLTCRASFIYVRPTFESDIPNLHGRGT